jgi:hypothetical protein
MPNLLSFHEQVFSAIEGLERRIGLDPNDPVVPFVLFLGTSTTLWYENSFVLEEISLFICIRRIINLFHGKLTLFIRFVQGFLLGVDI